MISSSWPRLASSSAAMLSAKKTKRHACSDFCRCIVLGIKAFAWIPFFNVHLQTKAETHPLFILLQCQCLHVDEQIQTPQTHTYKSYLFCRRCFCLLNFILSSRYCMTVMYGHLIQPNRSLVLTASTQIDDQAPIENCAAS